MIFYWTNKLNKSNDFMLRRWFGNAYMHLANSMHEKAVIFT